MSDADSGHGDDDGDIVDSDFFDSESEEDDAEIEMEQERELARQERQQRRQAAQKASRYVDPGAATRTARVTKRKKTRKGEDRESQEPTKRRRSTRTSAIRHRELVKMRLAIAEEKQAKRRAKRDRRFAREGDYKMREWRFLVTQPEGSTC